MALESKNSVAPAAFLLFGPEAPEAGKIVAAIQFKNAEPGADRVTDLPKLDEAEPKSVVDKGVLHPVAEGFLIGGASAYPIVELDALVTPFASSCPRFEFRRYVDGNRQLGLVGQQFPRAFEKVIDGRRATEDCDRLNQLAQGPIQVGSRGLGRIEHLEGGAVMLPALNQRFDLDQKFFRLRVLRINLEGAPITSGGALELPCRAIGITQDVVCQGVFRGRFEGAR